MEAILTPNQEFRLKREKAQRNMMWLAMGSMIMVFAGLTSAYVVRKGAGDWMSIKLPAVFWFSSAAIILSSVTVNLALSSFRKSNKQSGLIFLAATLVFGLLFSWLQFQGWGELTNNGIYLVHDKRATSLVSGSFIYLLSGLHLAHLAGGLIALIFTIIRGLMGRYSATNVHGVRLTAMYWHFLDALWIYLFLFLTIFK